MAEEMFFKYMECGGGKTLGEPRTHECVVQDSKGLMGIYRDFERGSIYWTSKTEAWIVKENILEYWRVKGAEKSELGYPVSDQNDNRRGWSYNKFQRGTIYCSPEKGCKAVPSKRPQDIGRWVAIVAAVVIFLAFAILIGVAGQKRPIDIVISIGYALISPLAGRLVAFIWPSSGSNFDEP